MNNPVLDVLLATREDRRARLVDLILARAPDLDLPGELRPEALLGAIAWQESQLGLVAGARVEPAYLPRRRFAGGGLYRRHVVALVTVYGDAAAASWGAFQIMFPTAWELGYRGAPWDLDDDEAGIYWTIKYIRRRALERGAITVEQIADAYNSGTHLDRFVPDVYVAGVTTHYQRILRRLETDGVIE